MFLCIWDNGFVTAKQSQKRSTQWALPRHHPDGIRFAFYYHRPLVSVRLILTGPWLHAWPGPNSSKSAATWAVSRTEPTPATR